VLLSLLRSTSATQRAAAISDEKDKLADNNEEVDTLGKGVKEAKKPAPHLWRQVCMSLRNVTKNANITVYLYCNDQHHH
jgi:hypothetical protein